VAELTLQTLFNPCWAFPQGRLQVQEIPMDPSTPWLVGIVVVLVCIARAPSTGSSGGGGFGGCSSDDGDDGTAADLDDRRTQNWEHDHF
jgi:hypothetical protein